MLSQDSYSFDLVVEVDYSVTSVTVTPPVVNAGASVTVQGSAAVDSNVTGQVPPRRSQCKQIQILARRAAASTAALIDLTVSGTEHRSGYATSNPH